MLNDRVTRPWIHCTDCGDWFRLGGDHDCPAVAAQMAKETRDELSLGLLIGGIFLSGSIVLGLAFFIARLLWHLWLGV